MISRKLEEAGLPGDLLYLSLIESGFSPVAYSRAHAVGLWQFIASTARMEGLEVSDFVDERRDPEKATDAAIRHLRRLHDRYGSWYLAAAAYNSGAGRVDRVLDAQVGGARGNDSIFWSIQSALPAETRDYVPMLIAATLLGRKRDVFGFGEVVPDEPEAVDVVTIPDATELNVIARAAEVSVETIKALNPQLFRDMTPPGKAIDVRVPAGRGEPFKVAFAKIPAAERISFIEHAVRRGETLSGIASRYGASVSDLQRLNGIGRPDRISVGRKLRVPVSAAARAQVASAGKVAMDAGSEPRTIVHLVRPGDTIWGIARKYRVTAADLLAWNKLTEESLIRPGDRIQVHQ
jgi:membrane-bound lytic murein transglycosylase D